jgi:hypothetical protein
MRLLGLLFDQPKTWKSGLSQGWPLQGLEIQITHQPTAWPVIVIVCLTGPIKVDGLRIRLSNRAVR